MSYGKRHSIYLRKGKDKDLIDYIDTLLPIYDFAEVARTLMRDGIKYRATQKDIPETTQTTEKENIAHTEQVSHTLDSTSNPISILPIKLNKVEVSEDVLINRLDDF